MRRLLNNLFLLIVISIAGVIINFNAANEVYAFHEGGDGYCEGCHEFHKSPQDMDGNNQLMSDSELSGNMLRGSDPSSTCLRCHGKEGKFYNVLSRNGSSFTAGGDFYWLEKTFSTYINGQLYISEADNHGHNIEAADYGLRADRVNSSAPGDIYPSSAMGCTSCHDPHGITPDNSSSANSIPAYMDPDNTPSEDTETDNFRLLGGMGYMRSDGAAGIIFSYAAPVAATDTEDWTETDSNHTAYGSGMSEWCGNCHGSFLNREGKHPSGDNAKLGGTIIYNYNAYIKTGNFLGSQMTSYSSLVPFEVGTTDISLLDPSSTSGPGSTGAPNVMCLSCHRAHASAFKNIGRWDFEATFIADSHPRSGDSGATGSDIINSYYGRNMTARFGQYQRQLCNKCHVQD